MKHWKRALIASSAGASVSLLLQGRKTAGLTVAGVGLIVLGSGHTDKFKRLYRNLPDYLDRGSKLLETASLIGQGIAQFAESRNGTEWDEARSI